MKHADNMKMNRISLTTETEKQHEGWVPFSVKSDVFKRLFKKSIFHITVKQNLSQMFCFHLIIDISTGCKKGLRCSVKY